MNANKFFIIWVAMVFFAQVNYAQVSDTVSTNSGYANTVFYSLNDGVVGTFSKNSWDIAFQVNSMGSGIRINGAAGVKLYQYPNGDVSAWNTLDTTNLSAWPTYNNSDTSWAIGAFNRTTDNNFDLGWGVYDFITHIVTGDSLYVLELPNGEFKKIRIESLASSTYTFRHADLNGSNEIQQTVSKGDFTNRNYAYYKISTDSVMDLEPDFDSWDLVFGQYFSEVAPGLEYLVSGVLTNPNVNVAKAAQVDVSAGYGGQPYSHLINSIGYDWKSFNGMGYAIQDSLVYFVEDQVGGIWKMIFTGFGGSADGNFIFTSENIVVALEEVHTESGPAFELAAYPNPSDGNFQMTLEINALTGMDVAMELVDIQGKTVTSLAPKHFPMGTWTESFQLENPIAGVYFLKVVSQQGSRIQKLMIH